MTTTIEPHTIQAGRAFVHVRTPDESKRIDKLVAQRVLRSGEDYDVARRRIEREIIEAGLTALEGRATK